MVREMETSPDRLFISYSRTDGREFAEAFERRNLPPWIRREEVYDTTEDERWRQLIRVLDGPGEVRRVPWMRDQLPDEFVPRPAEYDLLKHAVLSAGPEKAVALTTALSGAGGYGKTVLANYLCHDPDVRFEFTDGILRVDIGKERDDVTGLVIDLIEKIDPDAKRPGFQDVVTASAHLAELIGEARILLVIDDVWREAQLRPFLRGGPNCVRLVTTRLPHVLPASYIPIAIDEMRGEEALSLISVKLPEANTSIARRRLTALAGRLGNWAQMLSIANGWIRGRVSLRETVGDAIAKFERRLSARGLTAFDPKDETQRNRAIPACLEASLEDLQKDDLNRLSELAILPEDQSVPLAAIEALWRETGDLDVDETEDLVQRLHRLSLLQNLDLGVRALRLHDNMIWYLRDKIGAAACRGTHNAMIRATRAHCDNQSEWHTLSSTDAYGWQFLIRHLRGAGLDEEADGLLTDYAWIKAKLRASSAQKLYESYLPESPDEAARLIGRAISLSLPTLMVSARELPRQLFGRLGEITNHTAAAVVASAQQDADFRPAPRWPGLTPPGAERLRLVGHQEPVSSASFSPDGTSIVTASSDRTARLWDATTGQEIVALRGHEAGVVSASFSPDGTSIVTASIDGTARLWDATTGQEIVALRGHNSWLRSAAFSPDGTRIVTAAVDGTARLWDARTGQEIVGLRAHNGWVQSVAPSPDGARIVTTSQDGGVRLWDATTGQEIVALRADGDLVQSA